MSDTLPSKSHDITRAAHDWVVLIETGSATGSEREAFCAWVQADARHEEAYDKALTHWTAFDYIRADDLDADLHLPAAEQDQPSLLSQLVKRLSPTPVRAALACLLVAALAVPVGYIMAFQTGGADQKVNAAAAITYTTVKGETKTVSLSDGTEVTLGPATEIIADLSPLSRRITFESGAALFDVMRDETRPFIVTAEQLTTTVLGTTFDVRRNGGVSRVSVSEGQVEVSYPVIVNGLPTAMKRSVQLESGQQVAATQEQGLSPPAAIDSAKVGAWTKDDLLYNGASLAELVADANRYSERDILLADDAAALAGDAVTASFRTSDLDGMLEMLTVLFPVVLESNRDNVIVIRRDPSRG